MGQTSTTKVSDRAQALLHEGIVCDTTLPWGPDYENQETILPQFKKHGVGFVSLTIGGDWMGVEGTIRHMAAQRNRIMRNWGDMCHFVETADDMLHAKKAGKLGIGFHFQGTNSLGNDINMVETYYQLGVRHILFAYNKRTMAADGCHERTDGGLSRFGMRLVSEMNRVGMVVDGTHCGYQSSMEMMEASEAPAVFSHSNVYAIRAHARNLKDDQIKACAATGGFIGVNGVGHFLADDMVATPEVMVQHIDYIAELVGPEHVAIGLDHVYFLEQQHARRRENPDSYPEGYPPADWTGSYLGPEHFPEIAETLVQHGYGDDEIIGILGGNYQRIARDVWK